MATNQAGKPTQLLITLVNQGSVTVVETISDVNNAYNGYPIIFQVDVSVTTQPHSDSTTNTPFYYGAGDIEVNDWLLQPSGKAYRISNVVSIDGDGLATIQITDVDTYILLSDASGSGNNYPDENQAGLIIELDSKGMPIIANVAQLSGSLPDRGYWIDDLIGRFEASSTGSGSNVVELGVNTGVDLNKTSLVTQFNGDSTGITITFTPFLDSIVTVKINGVEVNLGDGVKTQACYFSVDSGVTARTIANITAGDTLYWNGSYAGFELDSSDDVDISYQKSNLG